MTREEFEKSRKKIMDNIMGSVDPEWGCPNESDLEYVNMCSIALIHLYDKFHSEIWLGNINLYDHNRHLSILKKYEGQKIHTFEYAYVIPSIDLELIRMVGERDRKEYTGVEDDAPLVTAIVKRVSDLGGAHLVWG